MTTVNPSNRDVICDADAAIIAGMEKRRPSDRLELVGERLRLFREAQELSQDDVAADVDKARNTVAMWETGQRLLDPLAAIRLAERYGVTLDWFYRGDLSGVRRSLADRIAVIQAGPDRTARKARPFAERPSSSSSPASGRTEEQTTPRRRRNGR